MYRFVAALGAAAEVPEMLGRVEVLGPVGLLRGGEVTRFEKFREVPGASPTTSL